MKLGVTLSSGIHVVLLAAGVLSFSAPAPLQVADVEALPIDIVPIEEFTTAVQGDREADLSDRPTPTPTTRPETVPDAQNTGDANTDSESQEAEKSADVPVEARQETAPPPAPTPTPSPVTETETPPAPEDAPAPTTELAATNDDAQPVPDEAPAEETPVAEEGERYASLENVRAVPMRRPEPPKPKTAETRERKQENKPAATTSASSKREQESVTDDIASLLNKQEAASSGAQRSDQQASLGTRSRSTGEKLTQSEMDALKGQLARCWSIPAGASGADELQASVEFELDPNAQLIGRPRVTKSSGNQAFDSSAVRAIQKCNQQGLNLPSGKHDVWGQVTVNFDPREMF